MLNGAVNDYTFACRLGGQEEIVSTQFLLPFQPNVAYSACLMNKVGEMIATGHAPYPVERTQLVSGILDLCLESKVRGNVRLDTPELTVRYRPPAVSQFAGDAGLNNLRRSHDETLDRHHTCVRLHCDVGPRRARGGRQGPRLQAARLRRQGVLLVAVSPASRPS